MIRIKTFLLSVWFYGHRGMDGGDVRGLGEGERGREGGGVDSGYTVIQGKRVRITRVHNNIET